MSSKKITAPTCYYLLQMFLVVFVGLLVCLFVSIRPSAGLVTNLRTGLHEDL